MTTRLHLVLAIGLALTGSTCLLGTAKAAEASDAARLIGAWHMVAMEEQGPDGKVTHHTDRRGMLVYTQDGHMSVQVLYPQTESASSANPAYAQGGYEASFGAYDVDEQAHTVTHHTEGSLVRALIGKTLPRVYQFSADGRLTLRSARTDEHWSVTWEHD